MDEFIADIRLEVPPEQASEVYTTLAKVFGNILRNPCDDKFRTLRKNNKLVAGSLGTSMSAVSLLCLVGFEDEEDVFHCPMTADLEQMRAANAVLQDMTLNFDLLESRPQPAQAGPLQSSAQPATSSKSAPPLRRAPRTSEEERGRAEQAEQLQALRALQGQRHREAGAPAAASGPTSSAAAMAEVPPPVQPDLLADGPSLGNAGAAGEVWGDTPLQLPEHLAPPQQPGELEGAAPVFQREISESNAPLLGDLDSVAGEERQGARKAGPRTLYSFKKRDAAHNSGDADVMEELKLMQQEKYRQFQSDPRAWDSEVYLRPPTGRFDGSSRTSSASTAPSSPGEWFSQESKRLSEGLKDASTRLTAGLNGVAGQLGAKSWGTWKASEAKSAEEEPEHLWQVGPLPGRFCVVGKSGAIVREGVEKDTPTVDVLHRGTTFVGLELATSSGGAPRLRLEVPLCGWLTVKKGIVERVVEEDAAEFG
mmetsp:Transcript_37799/g.112840  ORF Transcript_37799/g.112840 Transcript_37799/m.112840 type:complete len:480 (-) Transcript_37799:122-1561(-)